MFPLCLRKSGPVPLYTQQRKREKRHETDNGNTGYPSCFRNGLTCFCHVSVYGFLQFRPVETALRQVSPVFIEVQRACYYANMSDNKISKYCDISQ